MKKSTKLKKYSDGGGTPSKTKTSSPGGAYVTKRQYDASGNLIKETERRTVKGLLSGAPKAKGTTFQAYKRGGSVAKSKKK